MDYAGQIIPLNAKILYYKGNEMFIHMNIKTFKIKYAYFEAENYIRFEFEENTCKPYLYTVLFKIVVNEGYIQEFIFNKQITFTVNKKEKTISDKCKIISTNNNIDLYEIIKPDLSKPIEEHEIIRSELDDIHIELIPDCNYRWNRKVNIRVNLQLTPNNIKMLKNNCSDKQKFIYVLDNEYNHILVKIITNGCTNIIINDCIKIQNVLMINLIKLYIDGENYLLDTIDGLVVKEKNQQKLYDKYDYEYKLIKKLEESKMFRQFNETEKLTSQLQSSKLFQYYIKFKST